MTEMFKNYYFTLIPSNYFFQPNFQAITCLPCVPVKMPGAFAICGLEFQKCGTIILLDWGIFFTGLHSSVFQKNKRVGRLDEIRLRLSYPQDE